MIRINMMCVPQGIGMLRFDILSGQIWTTDCGKYHHYNLEMADDVFHSGSFPKTFSAHKNPFLILLLFMRISMYEVYNTYSGDSIREFEESELAWAFLDILVMRGWNEEYLGVRYVY